MRRVPAAALGAVFALSLLAPPGAVAADPPINDTYTGAILIPGVTVAGFSATTVVDMTAATYPGADGEPVPCGSSPARTVWYKFTASMSGTLTVTTAGSDVGNPAASVYLWPSSSSSLPSTHYPCGSTIGMSTGATYYIQGSDDGLGGNSLHLNLSFTTTVSYDHFSSARGMSAVWHTDVADLSVATLDPGESHPLCSGSDRTLWYRYDATANGALTLDIAGSITSGASLTIYRGTVTPPTPLTGITPMTCGYGTVAFNVQAGSRYYVQVSDVGPSSGYVTLTWSLGPSIDMTPPAIFGTPADMTLATSSPEGLAVTYDLPTAVDDVSGPVVVRCSPASGSVFPVGATLVTCRARDAAGNLAESSFTIRVELQIAVPGSLPISSYDVYSTPPSTWCGNTHTFSGAVVGTGRLVQGECYAFELINELDGSGTLNDGLISADKIDTQLFSLHNDISIGQPIQPRIVLRLGGLFKVSSISFYGGGPSGTPEPGALSALTVGLGDSSAHLATTPFGGGGYFGPVNDRIELSGTALSGKVTSTIELSDFEAFITLFGIPYRTFTIGEIVVESEAVIDTTPPVLTLPADITVDATNIDGAVVSYSATAVDDIDTTPTVACLPLSGSQFPIGATTVSCSATDVSGNEAVASFVVAVNVTYAVMRAGTLDLVWKTPIATQLNGYLDAASKAETRGNLKAEASNLVSYRSLLQAQVGKAISPTDAQTLIRLSLGL